MPRTSISLNTTTPALDHLEDVKAYHKYESHGVAESSEQQRLESKLKFKTDVTILPLCAITYFLASMVG